MIKAPDAILNIAGNSNKMINPLGGGIIPLLQDLDQWRNCQLNAASQPFAPHVSIVLPDIARRSQAVTYMHRFFANPDSMTESAFIGKDNIVCRKIQARKSQRIQR